MIETIREQALDKEVEHYVRRGYRVISRAPMSAQLVKPKHFGLVMLLVSLFTLGLGLVLYLMARDKTVYLTVDESGKVHRA